MMLLPWYWRFVVTAVLLLLVGLSQAAIWYATRGPWLAWVARHERWSERRRSRLRWAQTALYVVLTLLAPLTHAVDAYRIGIEHWWWSSIYSIYIGGSIMASPLIAGYALFRRIGRMRRRAGFASVEMRHGSAPPRLESEPVRRLLLPRRRMLQGLGGAALGAPFAVAAYGLFCERLDIGVTHVKLPLGPAAATLRGRTLAQISDIHIGPFFTARHVRQVVDMVNELNADIVLITGDLVTFRGDSQFDVVHELGRLRARTAILGCLGNHEVYTHTQASLTLLCAERGIDMLRFEGRRLDLGGGHLNIAGVDFLTQERLPEVQRVAEWMQPGEANLLLSHNPNAFDHLGTMPVSACIAGHTHGGQERFEFLDIDITPARLITPYIAGMYRRAGRLLYVNRGLGTVGLPIRIGAPPEITLFEIA